MNSEQIQLINIILHRLNESLANINAKYFNFKARNDARFPSEILPHLVDVRNYGLSMAGAQKPKNLESPVLEEIIENFDAMKSYLSNNTLDENITKKLINVPLSDTLTHIGQLALLRRLEGGLKKTLLNGKIIQMQIPDNYGI